jgi:hypothetical protein
LTIDEQTSFLGEESYNLYSQYWKAYQEYRKITPRMPVRGTPGKLEYNHELVFGRRNANLFVSYIPPTISPTPKEVNAKTEIDKVKEKISSKITNLKQSLNT